jgi:biopolymer transport protein TolR
MAIESGSDRLLSEINVTPMVDVMLVLLIIFMVSAPMMTQGVDVKLPHAVAKTLPQEQDPLMVTVNKDSQIDISGVQVSLDTLKDKLSKIIETRSDRQVYFRADEDIPYGIAVRIMAEIKNAGVEKLGMVTDPVDHGKTEKKDVSKEKKSPAKTKKSNG